MKIYYILIRISFFLKRELYCEETTSVNLNCWASSFYDFIDEITDYLQRGSYGCWTVWLFRKSKHAPAQMHIHMCPSNLKFHVPQQCSTTSDEVDLSIPRATSAKNVKDTKNPRKNKLQRPKSITTSAAKKTQVSDSLVNNKFYFSIQMSHAVNFFLCVFFLWLFWCL